MAAMIAALLLLALQLAPPVASDARAYSTLRRHPALFDASGPWPLTWFSPELRSILQTANVRNSPISAAAVREIMREEAEGVYSFPLFTAEFCAMFLEELDNYKATGLPIRRPNSMNRYGLIVNEIGMKVRFD